MMAARSPSASENEISSRTGRRPPSVRYSLQTLATCSKARFFSALAGRRADYVPVHVEQPVRRTSDAIVLTNAALSSLSERAGEQPILPEGVQTFCQRFRVVPRNEQSAAGLFDNLRERTPPRLYDRHARRHGLQQKDAFRLVVGSGNREHVERSQEFQLASSIDFAAIREFLFQPGPAQCLFHLVEIGFVGAAQVACRVDPDVRAGGQ